MRPFGVGDPRLARLFARLARYRDRTATDDDRVARAATVPALSNTEGATAKRY